MDLQRAFSQTLAKQNPYLDSEAERGMIATTFSKVDHLFGYSVLRQNQTYAVRAQARDLDFAVYMSAGRRTRYRELYHQHW